MTDRKWESIIKKSQKKLLEAFELRKIAETEYVRRYGQHPSEWDDDWWIDTVHYGRGDVDIQKIKEEAQRHKDGI